MLRMPKTFRNGTNGGKEITIVINMQGSIIDDREKISQRYSQCRVGGDRIMVNFIKNTTQYGLYIMESDSVGNDDWVTDHSHMKEADLDLFTEGDEYIYLPNITSLDRSPKFTFDVIDFFNGEGIDTSLAEGHDAIKVTGRFGGTEQAINNKMENFLKMFHLHLSSSQESVYLGIRKLGEIWEPFIDGGLTVKYYLKGKFTTPKFKRSNIDRSANWEVVFRGVW